MTNETEGGGVSGTRVVSASIKHPSLFTSLITGPTAEEGMGAVADKEIYGINPYLKDLCDRFKVIYYSGVPTFKGYGDLVTVQMDHRDLPKAI